MKLLLFSLATILVLNSVWAADVGAKKTCEDFLPVDTCTRLRNIAKEFNEKVGIVNQAITDAFNHHKTRAAEMLSYVKEYLVARATNFKCESVISAENCQKLQDIAKKLRLTATQASLAVKEAIVNGAQKLSDIYQKAVVYMRDRLSNLTCENVLGVDKCQTLKDVAALIHAKAGEVNKAVREAIIDGAANVKDQFQKALDVLENGVTCDKVLGSDRCNQLREAAKKLNEKVGIINEAIKAAIQKHYTKAQDILASVRDTLIEKANNFTCTDVMSQDACTKISDIGARLKLKAAEVTLALKEAIVNGAEQAKQIYDRAMGFLLNDVKNLKCEDLVKAETCEKVRAFALKVHGKATDTALAVKEAIIQGAQTAQETYQKAVDFLKAKISCENVLSMDTCDKIRAFADKFHISMKNIDAALREAVANGVTQVQELYKAAIKYITDKWTGVFGDEQISKRSITDDFLDFKDEWKKKLMEVAKKVLDSLKVTSETLRAEVMKAIEAGKVKLTDLKRRMLEILASLQTKEQDTIDDLNKVYKRSVREKLVEALKAARGKAKELIEKLLKLSKDKIEKIKDWLKQLKEAGSDISSDELVNDLDYVHEVLAAGANAHFDSIVEDIVDKMQE